MMNVYQYINYINWHSVLDVPNQNFFVFQDHLNGFDSNYKNQIFDLLQQKFEHVDVYHHNILNQKIHDNYPNLKLKFLADFQEEINFNYYQVLRKLKSIPANFSNFICSFNGTAHISRMLLISALHKFGWSNGSTKNFSIDTNLLDGFIMNTCPSNERLYRKFILTDDEDYNRSIINLENYDNVSRYDHESNISNLEIYLKSAFIHIVSETMATSYQPFVTEKILYPIVTKSMWVAYAAPGYHAHLEQYYGFKKFTIFDYSFDDEANPVVRLIAMLSSLAKFANLTPAEWHDLYLMEKDVREFNFDHYMSKSFLKVLKKYE